MGKVELNIEIDQSLLDEARSVDLDIEALAVDSIRRAVASRRASGTNAADARAWAEENAEALQLHRDRIARFGLFGEDLRRW